MAKRQYLAMTAIFACFFALAVIGLGAFTRLIDAGLGCPDWPGCYGHLIAPFTNSMPDQMSQLYRSTVFDVYKAWAEMIHRYFAAILGFIILYVVYLIFHKVRHRQNILLGCTLLILLAYQIFLGQWTVTYKLLPIVVTQHLLGGFLILTSLWLIYLNNRHGLLNVGTQKYGGIRWAALLGLIVLFLQILLGAWTSTNYASLSCPDFPFCLNSQPLMKMHIKEAFTIFPAFDVNYEGGVLSEAVRQTIQMMHRLGALIVTLYWFGFTAYCMTKIRVETDIIQLIYLIWGLLLTQIGIGMINIIYKLPVMTAVGHNLVAVLLLLSMVTLVFRLFSSGRVSVA